METSHHVFRTLYLPLIVCANRRLFSMERLLNLQYTFVLQQSAATRHANLNKNAKKRKTHKDKYNMKNYLFYFEFIFNFWKRSTHTGNCDN
jgi:hypothetical protein